MAFKHAGSLDPHGGPVLATRIITNSITVTELDSVKMASGFLALGTAGASVFGHVTAIRTNKGVGLETTGAAGAETGSFVGTFTTSSTNQTVAQVKADIDLSKLTLYSAEADATLGTTTNSNLADFNFDLIDEDTIDESDVDTAACQYHSHGPDPFASTSRLIVNVMESAVFGPLSA